MNNKPSAAIWCRVSTHDQRELSLDSQELAVRRVLETNGYDVPDWGSAENRLDQLGPAFVS